MESRRNQSLHVYLQKDRIHGLTGLQDFENELGPFCSLCLQFMPGVICAEQLDMVVWFTAMMATFSEHYLKSTHLLSFYMCSGLRKRP